MKKIYSRIIFTLVTLTFSSFSYSEAVEENQKIDIDLAFSVPSAPLSFILKTLDNLHTGIFADRYPVAYIELNATQLSQIGVRWSPTLPGITTSAKKIYGINNSKNELSLAFDTEGLIPQREESDTYYVTKEGVNNFETTVFVIPGTEIRADSYEIIIDAAIYTR
ncbi:hypothetical protein SAMN05192562_11321 [Kosakonia arachidis]|uniref:CS1 type fimbrial major subunit n=1 Tax=Kosakonia arachidis TaxID=551989 RepID=A0A1I7E9H1_9ENTR|nr:hypothetical protein [Kosakonia arachidis]SFU20616.1 hypothetical protein SAMN05192562_11321 [Kosakonia arachidis]